MSHYRTLQVGRNAEPEVVEKAYRALSLKYHPDRASGPDRERATRRMQRINEAYRVLGDPTLRARYDATLPSEDASPGGWERFMDAGLWGLFQDWARTQGS